MSFRDDAAERIGRLVRPDVLIIGGGVNGVAVLRELALNGVSTVLIDEGDFCRGATGASTRLAHGGLRYLENREFELVATAVRERGRLLRHAPHQVRPVRINVPLRHRVRGFVTTALGFLGLSGKRAGLNALSLRLALALYGFYGRGDRRRLPGVTARHGRDLPPGLAPDFRSLIAYSDARIVDPEGFVFELLEEALASSGDVAALNHVRWTRLSDGRVRIEDDIGEACGWTIRPGLVVNATGAWVDRVNSRLGLASDHVTAVKGAHLVIRNDALLGWLGDEAWYYDDGDGRMVICCPLGRTVLIGTTEIPVTDPDDRSVSDAEVDYLLRALGRLTADIGVERGQIVSTTSGCRPLRKLGSTDAYRANREHALHLERTDDGEVRVLSLVGGKWTTFRAFAEQASDRVFEALGRTRSVSTAERTYPGAAFRGVENERVVADITVVSGLPPGRVGTLVDRYRAAGPTAALFCARGPDRPLRTLPDYSEREILWLCRHRGARYVEDVLQRRSPIALDGRADAAVRAELGTLINRFGPCHRDV